MNSSLLAEIDQFAADPVPRRTPFVFVDEHPAIGSEAQVLAVQLMYFGYERLHDRGKADGLVRAHGNVAHAELYRVEKRVYPDIPPDFLAVVDAVGLNQ
jgi:hypothetical protein